MTSALRDPLAVEFAHAGGWYPGVLLGWRTDGPDRCWMRVQCVIGGLRRTTWMALTDLRLPVPAEPPPVDDVAPWSRPEVHGPDLPRPRTGHLTGERPLAFA